MSKRSNRSNRTTDRQDLPTNISERCKFTIKFNSTNISTGNYIFMSINIVSWWIQMHCYSKWIKQAGHAYCKPIILPVHCSIGRKRITSVTIIIIVAIILIVIVIIVLVSSFSDAPASLALMIVTDSLTDGLIETGDWQFLTFDSYFTICLV